MQDTENAAATGRLYLSYGPYDDADLQKVADTINRVALAEGYTVEWNGTVQKRIALCGLDKVYFLDLARKNQEPDEAERQEAEGEEGGEEEEEGTEEIDAGTRKRKHALNSAHWYERTCIHRTE